MRVDEAELDRAVANVAAQNQLTLPQLRERLRREGIDYARFRDNLRDQMLVERVREREVASRIRITDAEIDAPDRAAPQRGGASAQFNIAQILVHACPKAPRRGRGRRAPRARRGGAGARPRRRGLRRGGPRALARTATAPQGGEIGLRPADRLPDVFVEAVRPLKAGEVAPSCCAAAPASTCSSWSSARTTAAFTRHSRPRPPHPAAALGRS